MKAIQFAKKGGTAEVASDVAVPTPGDNDLLVEVVAASINPVDWKMMAYNFFNFNLPWTLGFDFSGKVVATGSKVTDFKVGEIVYGQNSLLRPGCLAEYVAVDQDRCAKKPAAYSFEEAAGAGVGWLSVLEGLTAAEIKEGEWIYIPGGNGGVAHFAVQYAKALGCKVITSASKPEGVKYLKELKCDVVFNYKEQKAEAEVLKATDNKGASLTYDSTYAAHEDSAKCTAANGRLVVLGDSWKPDYPALKVATDRKVKVVFCDLGKYSAVPDFVAKQKAYVQGGLEKLSGLASKIKPQIKVVSWAEGAKALNTQGADRGAGKIVVSIRPVRKMKACCMIEKAKPAKILEIDIPTPSDTEVLIDVHAASLNPVDWKYLEFNFFNSPTPFVLGFDVAGTVIAAGSKVTDFKVGDAVFGCPILSKGGCFAQYCVADQDRIALKPAELSFEECAAGGVAFGSVWEGMQAATIKKDEWVYIPGGAGGVAHVAIQIAKAFGAKVISSGSRPESMHFLTNLMKCDAVFDYKKEKAVDFVKKTTGGKGADVVYDATYNTYEESAKCVAKGGRLIYLSTDAVKENVQKEAKDREATIFYCDLVKYATPQLADKVKAGVRGAMEQFASLCQKGYVKMHVSEAFRLEEAPKEIAGLKGNRTTVGKAVCRVKW